MEAWTIGIDGEATLDDEELRMLLRFTTDLESEIDFVAALVLLGTADAHLPGSLLALEMDGLNFANGAVRVGLLRLLPVGEALTLIVVRRLLIGRGPPRCLHVGSSNLWLDGDLLVRLDGFWECIFCWRRAAMLISNGRLLSIV
ncbi:hypothetical protein ACLOJK_005180 [Asimina triloba]